MIGSIFIALSGLRGFESGLRLIANNTSNLNTPGFKGSRLMFADSYYARGGNQSPGGSQIGYGLGTLGTRLDLQQGQLQTTGNSLDVAVDGEGMFILRNDVGDLHYTRDGQFAFDNDGKLVSLTTGEQVMGLDANGGLAPIELGGMRTNPAAPTANIVMRGNLSSTVTTRTVSGVTVIDRVGSSHSLSVRFDAVTGSPGTWTVTVLDGTATVATGQVVFVNGQPTAATSRMSFRYSVSGQADLDVNLDLSTNVTSFDSGSTSTLAMSSQDGHAQGDLTSATFDKNGVLQLGYSNGQTAQGASLALARYASAESVRQVGSNEFVSADGRPWEVGRAMTGSFGSVKAGVIEGSNVDLSQQFTELVIMQRGYQASSQVVSTANEMMNELFNMRGR